MEFDFTTLLTPENLGALTAIVSFLIGAGCAG